MKRYPLVAFVAITFLISWGAWLGKGEKQGLLIGAFAPGIAAIVVAGFSGGLANVQALVGRLLLWRVHAICYVAALALPTIVSLLSTAVHMMFGGDAPDFGNPPIKGVKLAGYLDGWNPVALIMPLFLQHVVYGTALAEELGWRGLALPRLQERHNSLVASLILGGLWAVWILPFYWMQGWIGGNERAFLLLGVIPGAVLSTWIYNISGGSLLLCVIFNIAFKVTDLILASPASHPLVPVMAYWMAAGMVLSFTGVNLAKEKLRPQNPGPQPQPQKLVGDDVRSL